MHMVERQIISRAEALARGLTHYFTGKLCKSGHLCERRVDSKNCVECHRLRDRRRLAQPGYKEARAEYDRRRWLNERAYMENKNRRYQQSKKDQISAQKKKYSIREKSRLKAARKIWVENNRPVIRALNAARKRVVARATPEWVDRNAIRQVYREAERLSRATGIPHHVDHIVPLQGETICGLHVPWNLRPLPAFDNISKKNRLLSEAS